MTRLTLALDASAGPASVALFRDAECVAAERIDRTGSAELLAPTIDAALRAAHVSARELTDVIVGGGPGSFTGLRVVAALGKGLARGAGATLHSVPSLALIAGSLPSAPPGSYLAVLDALRGEWFTQSLTRHEDGRWSVTSAVTLVATATISARAAAEGLMVVGPPVDASQQPDAHAALAVGATVVSLESWEPDYGRLAEAQVKWEAANARALPAS